MAFNILLVDDSNTVRSVIKKAFRLAEVPVNELHEASNGKEALDILSNHWIDIVFSDINMPVMTGIELVDKMRADGLLKTVPVVAISIEGSAARIEELKAKGVSAYIRKPFTPELIREVVEEILGPKMHTDHRGILSEVLRQVLERFAFMFSELVPREELPPTESEHRLAEMSFTGRVSGSLAMAVPKEMCQEIAANVLGIEADDALAIKDAEDALKEVLNLTCGQVLTSIAGEKALFDLSVPETAELDAAGWQSFLEEPETVAFLVDDNPVLLRLKLKDHGP